MLLWALLHLSGTRAVNADYERLGEPAVSLDDIKRFRQLDSKAAGHPEHHWTSGVETTTGPLGQGVATSVGMAIVQKWLASRYNRPGAAVFDYRIYAVCGDGCMMEGVAARHRWTEMFHGYQLEHPELACEIEQIQRRDLPSGWDRDLPVFPPDAKGLAGRDASGEVLNVIAQSFPWLLGGSADLGPSNKTTLKYRVPAISRPPARAGRTCISASASTRWRRSSTG